MNARQRAATCVFLAAPFGTAIVHAGLIRHDRANDAYVERGRQPEFASVCSL